MVVVEKPLIIDLGKVLVEASSIVQFSVTYGSQAKDTDESMSSIAQTVVKSGTDITCYCTKYIIL